MKLLLSGTFKLACVALVAAAVVSAPATAILLALPAAALATGGVDDLLEAFLANDGLIGKVHH